jgi:hypothetical protein
LVHVHDVHPLEVWTRQLAPDRDSHQLDITRGSATRAWKRVPADAVDVEGVLDALLERRSDEGVTLLEVAREATAQHLPAVGEPWAPSWGLLKPALAALDEAEHLRGQACALRPVMPEEVERQLAQLAQAEGIEVNAWNAYTTGFRAEMAESWISRRRRWRWALGLAELHLACTCSRERAIRGLCHRVLVAGMLGALGAAVKGEMPESARW